MEATTVIAATERRVGLGTSKRTASSRRDQRKAERSTGSRHAETRVGRPAWVRPPEAIMAEPIEFVTGDWSNLPRKFVPVAERSETCRLSVQEERETFLWMNFLRYRAETVRQLILSEGDSHVSPAVVERLLEEATAVRNYLVVVYSRLAAAVVRQHVSPENRMEELLSEAHLTLLRAVELFDVKRGYRFSTYITNAVRHNLNRWVVRQHKLRQSTRDFLSHDEVIAETFESPQRLEREYTSRMSRIVEWVQQLDPRERHIVSTRYGLVQTPSPVTLQTLADQMGVSRERVRQLERRALDKLKSFARYSSLDG